MKRSNYLKGKKIFQALFTFFIVGACSNELFFSPREYYVKDVALKFNSDKTYTYSTRSESYIKTFNRGTWRQDGKKIILSNGVSSLDELPFAVDEFESNTDGKQIIVNIRPPKRVDWEQSITDVINVEMIADGKIYSIKNHISVINLKSSFHSAYFRAYPKSNSLNICEQLNDTLRSKLIKFLGEEKGGALVNLDINPLYFSQIKLSNDTLKIINDRKIKWNKIYLKRPQ